MTLTCRGLHLNAYGRHSAVRFSHQQHLVQARRAAMGAWRRLVLTLGCCAALVYGVRVEHSRQPARPSEDDLQREMEAMKADINSQIGAEGLDPTGPNIA